MGVIYNKQNVQNFTKAITEPIGEQFHKDVRDYLPLEQHVRDLLKKNKFISFSNTQEGTSILTVIGAIKFINSIENYRNNHQFFTYLPMVLGKEDPYNSRLKFRLLCRRFISADVFNCVLNLITRKSYEFGINDDSNSNLNRRVSVFLTKRIINTAYGTTSENLYKKFGWILWNEFLNKDIARFTTKLLGITADSVSYSSLALNWATVQNIIDSNQLGLLTFYLSQNSFNYEARVNIDFVGDVTNLLKNKEHLNQSEIDFLSTLPPNWIRALLFTQHYSCLPLSELIYLIKDNPKYSHFRNLVSFHNHIPFKFSQLFLKVGSNKSTKTREFTKEVKLVIQHIYNLRHANLSAHEKIFILNEIQYWFNKYNVDNSIQNELFDLLTQPFECVY